MFLSLVAGTFLFMQPALDLPEPTEEMRGQYFAPNTQKELNLIVDDQALSNIGVFAIANYLTAVEEAAKACATMRKEMTALIMSNFGSYSVHPTWLQSYQSCLLIRQKEIEKLGAAIEARKPMLLEGLSGGAASRTTDIIARLSAFQTRVKLLINAEFDAQNGFVEAYNRGGGLKPEGASQISNFR